VADVGEHFATRWRALTDEQLEVPRPPAAAGEHAVQLVRTVAEGMYELLPHGEFGILESHTRALRSSEHLIYIENQFLWAPEIVRVLTDKLRNPPRSDFRLTVGSANLNAHSLLNDTECNVATQDRRLARETRVRPWAEHLELDDSTVEHADPRALVDDFWRPIAFEQLDRRRAGAPPTHRLIALPGVSRRSRRLLGPLQGLIDDA
jgi:phosphatidylserine/phosphatidylglycerophosphate/cardiolipin synthase-like enzyme